MTAQRYQRISDIFLLVSDMPVSARMAAIDSACQGDAELRDGVLQMLQADQGAAQDGFLAGNGLEDAAQALASDATDLPAPGTVLGNYRLGARIGAGGMGVVYAAEDLSLRRSVAIKILPPLFSGRWQERLQRFQREARAAAHLTHPHIAAVYGTGSDKGWPYIAMEFVEGRTLRALIADKAALPDDQTILEILAQTASALSAAHEAGIIHRDIKPENIMLRPDGFVKVLDFGLASMREPSQEPGAKDEILRSRPGQVAGTVHYVSPEQVMGQTAGARSDLFSLGVVGYELATGTCPFDGPTDGAVFDAIVHRQPALPSASRPSLGRDFDDFILHALQKEAELRFQTASDFRGVCLRLARNSTPGDGTPVPPRSRRKRRFRVAGLAAGIMAAASAAAALASFFWPLPTPRVLQIVQITRSEDPVTAFVSDGARLYYAAGANDKSLRMFQVSATGGEPVLLPQFTGMSPLDLSPDRSQLLLRQFNGKSGTGPFPIWIAPVLGSGPRRLGTLEGQFARWSPGGNTILYSDHGELKLADHEGHELREIARLKGLIEEGEWSPDGSRIRFTVARANSRKIWEVNADGSGLQELLASWHQPWLEMGSWTPDGKYFLFSAGQSAHDLWVRREGQWAAFRRGNPLSRLTNGPLWALDPHATGQGERVYFRGLSNIGKLVRLDPASRQWMPYLGGIDAVQLDFSRDRRWIAYADSNGCLWRSRADGSERIQLTTAPLVAHNPVWSPDGERILFFAAAIGQPDSIYLVPRDAGAVTRLTGEHETGETDPSWSPDGSTFIYGLNWPENAVRRQLYEMDLLTRRQRKVPETEQLWSPRWSPDGKYVAALNESSHLMLYDRSTRKTVTLASFSAGYPVWARDSRSIYFENNSSSNWYRVSLTDRKVETLESLSGLATALNSAGWVGMTPDGAILSARALSSGNIFALDWEAQ